MLIVIYFIRRGTNLKFDWVFYDYVFLECAVLQESRDKYHEADSMKTLFETIPFVKFLKNDGLFYLIWMVKHPILFLICIDSRRMQLWTWISLQNMVILSDLAIC